MQHRAAVALCCLLAGSAAAALKQPYLQVYQECTAPDGTIGRCRGSQQASTSAATTAQTLVIDMSVPCTNRRRCAENVDAAEKPLRPPTGAGVRSCSVSLMPLSPFPCTYNSQAYAGTSDQNKTDWCFTAADTPPEYPLARSLTTDGYTNIYTGVMPETPCGAQYVHAATIEDAAAAKAAATMSSHGKKRSKPTGKPPPFGRHFVQVLLTLDFSVAAGRQFDRAFTMQIGDAVVAFGTCSEPTRSQGTDKQWRTTLDVTHLQAYFAKDQPVRFSLGNLLSSTYNVPIWASAKLEFSWLVDAQPWLDGYGDEASAVVQARGGAATPAFVHSTAPGTPAVVGADVPDEVLPLVPAGAGDDSTVSLSGNGDNPAEWPRVTFTLPASLSEAGNIYRAQLLVVPKANGCEEFWAMTPSGSSTNSTCPPGGPSTGEPYREVRVYVNGQLAGFSPIFYTMYTGGIDPRLWSAVVGAYAFALPSYRFDLSPWLPQLNMPPAGARAAASGDAGTQAGDQKQQQQSASEQEQQADMPSTSRRLAGVSAQPPAADAHASSDQRLPPNQAARAATTAPAAASGEAPASTSAAAGAGRQQQKQQKKQEQKKSGHTITVELGGETGSDWILANTLLLWRAGEDDNGQPITVTGEQQPSLLLSPGFDDALSSDCSSTGGASLSEAGRCVLQLQNRGMLASAVLQMAGCEWLATAHYSTKAYFNDISFNNTSGYLDYKQTTKHEARWSVTRLAPEGPLAAPAGGPAAATQQDAADSSKAALARAAAHRGPRTLTQSDVRYDWLNAGGVSAGAVYEFSYNATLVQPSIYAALGARRGKNKEQPTVVGHGRQRHYQRALMLNVYDPASPACVPPDYATHTVVLHNSVTSFAPDGGEQRGRSAAPDPEHACYTEHQAVPRECVARKASAAFCAANVMTNIVDFRATGC